MALGDNNSKNTNNENTFYSRVKFKNGDLSLGFSFWKGLLKVSISQAKQTYSGTEYEELTYIHLSPLKAKLLSDILKKMYLPLSFNDSKTYGVDTGITDVRNIISFGNDVTASKKDSIKRYVTIGKVDPDGNLQNPVRFDFNSNYHFAIEWNDFEKMDCNKAYDNDLEIDIFIIVLDQFVESMTGAHSYGVMDMMRFDNSRINTKIELVMDKLGIERKGNKGSGDLSNSFFNKNGAASPQNSNRGRSNSTTMEDIEDMMS